MIPQNLNVKNRDRDNGLRPVRSQSLANGYLSSQLECVCDHRDWHRRAFSERSLRLLLSFPDPPAGAQTRPPARDRAGSCASDEA